MLGLQVTAPGYLILKFIIVLLKDLDRLGVGHMAKLGVEHVIQTVRSVPYPQRN